MENIEVISIKDEGDVFEARVKTPDGKVDHVEFSKEKTKKVEFNGREISQWKKELLEEYSEDFEATEPVAAQQHTDKLVVTYFAENKQSFTVKAEKNGVEAQCSYPKNGKWLAEDENGVPRYVKSLNNMIEDKIDKDVTPSNEVGNEYEV